MILRGIGGLALAACVIAVLSGGCSRPSGKGPGGTIQIKGSDTMVNLGQAWAEEFMKAHPEASVAVTGGGSGTGIAAVINQTADVAQSSRSMKDEEIDQAKKNGVEPKERIVGHDGIAVVVHPNNPVSELTVRQAADIFSGKIANWSEVGGPNEEIVILSREVNSGTHVYFKETVLNGGDAKGSVEFAAKALLMPSSQAIADEVAVNEKAIGYYGMGYISEKQKALRISPREGAPAVEPSGENVLSGAYPVSRPLFLYTRGEPEGTVKDFVDFTLSADGQEIVKRLDFVPVQ